VHPENARFSFATDAPRRPPDGSDLLRCSASRDGLTVRITPPVPVRPTPLPVRLLQAACGEHGRERNASHFDGGSADLPLSMRVDVALDVLLLVRLRPGPEPRVGGDPRNIFGIAGVDLITSDSRNIACRHIPPARRDARVPGLHLFQELLRLWKERDQLLQRSVRGCELRQVPLFLAWFVALQNCRAQVNIYRNND
jgi:hypothetical protein